MEFVMKLIKRFLRESNSPRGRKASGDYYFDVEIAKTGRAFALRIPGIKKPVPYHYKVKAGTIPQTELAILIIGEPETTQKGAIEDDSLSYARLGALLDLIDYLKEIKHPLPLGVRVFSDPT